MTYKTKPLDRYDPVFQTKAEELFERVKSRLISLSKTRVNERAIKYKGSYSFLEPNRSRNGRRTSGKIIIATPDDATNHGMPDGDGVYILLRAEGCLDAWLKHDPWIRADPGLTLTINSVPFYYFWLSDRDDMDGLADAIAAVIRQGTASLKRRARPAPEVVA